MPHAHTTRSVTTRQRTDGWTWILRAMALSGIAASAILAKEARVKPRPLMDVKVLSTSDVHSPGTQSQPIASAEPAHRPEEMVRPESIPSRPSIHEPQLDDARSFVPDPELRWFSGRPVRPARRVWMNVTAYSPDERSCGEFADGFTATLHHVTTNAHRLVAADPRVLPYGTLLSVPGYAMIDAGDVQEPAIVPVLDCGGKIKGHRLDVLFPTHEEALRWGVRTLPITIWEYADGAPAPDPRKAR